MRVSFTNSIAQARCAGCRNAHIPSANDRNEPLCVIPPLGEARTQYFKGLSSSSSYVSNTWVEGRVLPLMGISPPPVKPVRVPSTASESNNEGHVWYNVSQLDCPERFDEHTIEREKIPLGLFNAVIDGPEDALELQALMKRHPNRLSSPYWVPLSFLQLVFPPNRVCDRSAGHYSTRDGLSLVNACMTRDRAETERLCRLLCAPQMMTGHGKRYIYDPFEALRVFRAILSVLPGLSLTSSHILVPAAALPDDEKAEPVISIDDKPWILLSHSFPRLAKMLREYKPRYHGEAASSGDIFCSRRAYLSSNHIVSFHALKTRFASAVWVLATTARANSFLVLGEATVGNTTLANIFSQHFFQQMYCIPKAVGVPYRRLYDSARLQNFSTNIWVERRVLPLMGIRAPSVKPVWVPSFAGQWYNVSQLDCPERFDKHTIEREKIPLGLFSSVIDGPEDALELQALMKRFPDRLSSPYWLPTAYLRLLRVDPIDVLPAIDAGDLYTCKTNGLQLVNAAQTTNPQRAAYLCNKVNPPRLISFESDQAVEDIADVISLLELIIAAHPKVDLTSQAVLVPFDRDAICAGARNIVFAETSWALLDVRDGWKVLTYKPWFIGGARNCPIVAAVRVFAVLALRTKFASNVWMLAAEAEGREIICSTKIGNLVFVNVRKIALYMIPSVSTSTISSKLRGLLEAANCTTPFWIADCIVPLLRLVPERAGVEHGRRTWYNAEHFAESERHRFRDDMATTEQIPLTWRGLPFSAESGLALQQVMRDRGLREPYWLPLAGMERVFGMSPLPRAKVERVSDMDLVHVSETTNPGSFDVRRTGRHALMLTTMTTNHVLKIQEHARFLEFSQTRADDSTACRWIDEDVLHCTRAGGVRDGQPSVSSPPSRTFAWRNKRWFNAHDFMTEPLARILKYGPRFVAGCVAPPAEFHIQLAVHAWRTGSCSSLWTTDDLYQADGSLLVVSSVLIDDVVWLNVMHLGKRNRIMLPKIDDSSSRSGSVT